MVTLSRRLRSRLCVAIDAWDRFQQKDVCYFRSNRDSEPIGDSLSPLDSSIDVIDDYFLDLKGILKKLRSLEDELCQDNPQGVSLLLPEYKSE